jgi:hypothetical protein
VQLEQLEQLEHLLAVMRIDTSPAHCTGLHSCKDKFGNVTRCWRQADSTDNGILLDNFRDLASLPNMGCKDGLTQWTEGRAIQLATSPDGGCAPGCHVWCNYHGPGHTIDPGWQALCDSGVCCSDGTDGHRQMPTNSKLKC